VITQDDQDYNDFERLPDYVIKQAAAELIVKYLMPEIEAFMSMAIDALAHDTAITNEEAAAILWTKVGSMAKGLKLHQWTVNHAAIYFKSWALFDERENPAPLQTDGSAAIWRNIEIDSDEDEDGGETVAA
jgi:hypothetical protein